RAAPARRSLAGAPDGATPPLGRGGPAARRAERPVRPDAGCERSDPAPPGRRRVRAPPPAGARRRAAGGGPLVPPPPPAGAAPAPAASGRVRMTGLRRRSPRRRCAGPSARAHLAVDERELDAERVGRGVVGVDERPLARPVEIPLLAGEVGREQMPVRVGSERAAPRR